MAEDYQFDDLDSITATGTGAKSASGEESGVAASAGGAGYSNGGGSGNGSYASELYSKQIKAKFRTFFVDLKESSNGKFIKISEKSHGRKSTIMMDAEDVPIFIEALKEVQEKL